MGVTLATKRQTWTDLWLWTLRLEAIRRNNRSTNMQCSIAALAKRGDLQSWFSASVSVTEVFVCLGVCLCRSMFVGGCVCRGVWV